MWKNLAASVVGGASMSKRSFLTREILDLLTRGYCCQVVALKGMGHTRLAKSLPGTYIDLNLQPKLDSAMLRKLVSPPGLLLFDGFERLLKPEYTELFVQLEALHDQLRPKLPLTFFTPFEIDSTYQILLSDLYEYVVEHVFYLPPLDISEYDYFDLQPTSKERALIEKLSGGIPALVKICVLGIQEGRDLSPTTNALLKGQLDEILAALPDTSFETLRKFGIDQSQLVRDYLPVFKSRHLTLLEQRLVDYLIAHVGEMVTRDQIAMAVYPDVKNLSGVSDQALDQLIFRTKKKLPSTNALRVYKGQGVILETKVE